MKRALRLTFILTSALATLPCAAASGTATRSARSQTLLFEAVFTRQRTAGPDANHVGHEQLARGVLRNSGGRAVGRFAFTCTWTRILASGDALERCTGSGRTAEGRLAVAGAARESQATASWRLTGQTGAYRGAHGTVLVREIGDREELITGTIRPAVGTLLHVAVIRRPAANAGFIAHADHICTSASGQLSALPPFPFANFDPLHPDPALLAQVGAYFTGRGDPRPILGSLDARLRALARPPASRGGWKRMLRARTVELAVINEQDNAALTANVAAFVNSVQDSTTAFRQVAITASVFGATRCVL